MLEQNLIMEKNLKEYMNTKYELENFSEKIAGGVKIHSKSNCCLYGEKCSNLFFNPAREPAGTLKTFFQLSKI